MIKKFICKVFNLVPQSRYEELHNALNNEISQLQKQLKENTGQYQNDLASLHAQIESLVSKKKALEEELSQSNKRIAELTKANEILSHRIKELENAISEEKGKTNADSTSIKNYSVSTSNHTKSSDNNNYRSINTKDYNTKHKHLSLTNKIDFKKLMRDGRYNDKTPKSKVYNIDAKIQFIIEQLAKLNLKVKFDGNSFWYEKKDNTGKRELPYNTMEIYNDSIIVLYSNKSSEGFDLNTGKRVSSYNKKDDLLRHLDNYFEEEYINKV
ncbi:MAG: hypothetical protein IJE52_03905 [Bacteroidales bacterium]|nr:hypothetical protein [Bacteroidales bacterium]